MQSDAPDPKIVVLSASLNDKSRSRILAEAAAGTLSEQDESTVEVADLRDFDLPFCNAGSAYSAPDVNRLKAILEGAEGIIVASPIYNFDVNAALKNALELTGDAWNGKVVAFLNAAGGSGSYMSVMSFANSLMLDFRAIILPRFVYATGKDFDENNVVNAEIAARIAELARETRRFAKALRQS
jgi:FMN reductase